jgi:hypothetical protein
LGIPEQQGIPFELSEPESSSKVVVQDFSDIAGSSGIIKLPSALIGVILL